MEECPRRGMSVVGGAGKRTLRARVHVAELMAALRAGWAVRRANLT